MGLPRTPEELWRLLRGCRDRQAVLEAAGQPDRSAREHPKEDWTESCDYDCTPRHSPVLGFTVRFAGDVVHSLDTRWVGEPPARTAVQIGAAARLATADEVRERLGYPDELRPTPRGEVWFYWIRRHPAHPDGREIVIRQHRVRRVRKPGWFP